MVVFYLRGYATVAAAVMMPCHRVLFSFQRKTPVGLLQPTAISLTDKTTHQSLSLSMNKYLLAARRIAVCILWCMSKRRARPNMYYTPPLAHTSRPIYCFYTKQWLCLSSQDCFTAFLLPAQLETLPGNLCAHKFQSLFLVVCVMCIQSPPEGPQRGSGRIYPRGDSCCCSFQAEVRSWTVLLKDFVRL